MRSLFLVLVLISSCSLDETLDAIPNCNQDCAVDRDGTFLLGENARVYTCNVGTVLCADGVETCEGFIPFGPEVCDEQNIDEDCNGFANDIEYSPFDYRNTCNLSGACASTKMTCGNDGSWFCRPSSAVYGEEICDGVDNDCDGLIDAADPDLPNGNFVYTGPFDTVNVGTCRAGVERCLDGHLEVIGEVLPRAEACGNDIDDDCDGLVDESDTEEDPVAVMLVIDFSGSMQPYIESVVAALCGLAQNGILARSKFSAVAVAAENVAEPHIEVISYFDTVGATCTALTQYLQNSNLEGGREYIPYAIWSLNLDNEDNIGWPEALERQVIFFTDESPHGYDDSPQFQISLAAASCNEQKYSVNGFNNSHEEWQALTDPCSGWQEFLGSDSEQTTRMIQRKFVGRCSQ